MPLIVTPGQFSQRADFYHQLAQLTAAGIGVTNALEQLKRHPPARSYRRPLEFFLIELAKGKTFSESLRSVDWLPDFDLTLIEAGERSGRLDHCFRALAEYYNQRATLAKQIISELLYPAFLIHFAALIFLIVLPWATSQFNASLPMLLLKATLKLSPIYIITALTIYANQSKHNSKWRAFMDGIWNCVPVLRSARHSLALSRLTLALEALISAGVGVIQAWELAVTASNSPRLQRAVVEWKSHFANGRTPAELVGMASVFPETFANLYHSGEISGKLDETLLRLHTFYQEDATYKFHLLSQWIPRLIYILVVIAVAFKVIQFWTGYYSNVSKAIDGF
ncbi:MAG TPA: type II secretion system F family protein [Candidatus Baltobacteraceae bacterium]|nr:type II secretion system F family protein [Candidatus Baltobacteraceae bacterium]